MRPVDVNNDDARLKLDVASVVHCLNAIEAHGGYPVPQGSLDVVFVTEARCSQLHLDFFDDPAITDVMTFPGDPEDGHAGDIAICPAVAFQTAGETGLSFREELTLYLVHAWLHLAGCDDKEPDEEKAMRTAETILMDKLVSAGSLIEADWSQPF